MPIGGSLLGRPFLGHGFVDDSAGYHARVTAWRWSAGVGVAESGAAVAWNLVDGVHDALQASERTVWVDGTPHHVPPQPFADDLSAVGELRCEPVAVRKHRQNRLVVVLGVRDAVRALQRLAPGRRAAARGLGSDGAPPGAVVALCKSIQGFALRRCLLIAAFLLLGAPAAGVAQERATVKLSSKPDKIPAGEPWKVTLTIKQPGRAARADLRPAVIVKDADGFTTTYPARAAKKAGRYKTTVVFPRAGQFTYAVRDGLSTAPPEYRSVIIKAPAPTVDRPDPVGPPELPIIFAGVLALGAAGYVLIRRRQRPPAQPA